MMEIGSKYKSLFAFWIRPWSKAPWNQACPRLTGLRTGPVPSSHTMPKPRLCPRSKLGAISLIPSVPGGFSAMALCQQCFQLGVLVFHSSPSPHLPSPFPFFNLAGEGNKWAGIELLDGICNLPAPHGEGYISTHCLHRWSEELPPFVFISF